MAYKLFEELSTYNLNEICEVDLRQIQKDIEEEFKRRRYELKKQAVEELNAFIEKWEKVGITFETKWYDLKVGEFKIYDSQDDEEDDD